MNRETSLYLDLIRFLASMIVLLGHLSGERFTGGLFWQFSAFMDDAVIVFFVLSGFVIAYTVKQNDSRMESFIINRAARIYSVALPALFLTFILDFFGKNQAPNLYSADWGYQFEGLTWQFLSGFLFLNQSWFAPVPVGSMLPYWSLSYEVWYYLIFAAVYFMRGKRRILAAIVAGCIAGPKILVLFPLWVIGYCSYIYSAQHKSSKSGLFLLLVSIVGYTFHHFFLKEWLAATPHFPSSIVGDDLYTRYITGLLFACHLIGFVWASTLFGKILNLREAEIRWFAGATFTIYLLHLPIAQFLITIVPWVPSDWRTRAFILLGTLVIIFIIAHFTERKKSAWRNVIRQTYSVFNNRARQPDQNPKKAGPEKSCT